MPGRKRADRALELSVTLGPEEGRWEGRAGPSLSPLFWVIQALPVPQLEATFWLPADTPHVGVWRYPGESRGQADSLGE